MTLLNIAGFNVLHLPRPNELITVRVAVEAGSSNEKNTADYGVAHYLEHMFFKGTKTKNFKELNQRMAALGSYNAYTSQDRTVFYINTIHSNFEEATKLLTDLLLQPKLDEAEFNKERNVIIEEFQSCKDDPGSHFYHSAFEYLFGPQGHHIVGTEESLSNLKIQQLIDFRNRHYAKDNMVFIVCGNIDEDSVRQIFEKALTEAGKETPEKCSDPRDPIKFSLGKSDKNFQHSSEQAYMSMYFRGQTPEERKAAGHVNGLFANAMGGGLHSILGSRIREELGLCYSIYMSHDGYDSAKATYVNTQLQKANIPLARSSILEEMEKVRKNGFTQDLIETTRSNTLYNFVKGAETSSGYAKSFGDSYLQARKIYSDEELTLEYFMDQIKKIGNDDYIRHANWVGDQYNFVSMNGE